MAVGSGNIPAYSPSGYNLSGLPKQGSESLGFSAGPPIKIFGK
jgi:hypothetical protein